MTGQWEKYVQAAADEITYHPGNRTGTPESRHPVSVMLARAVLATVGPLIAEETRERMVAAAGAALEREPGGVEWEAVMLRSGASCKAAAAASGGQPDAGQIIERVKPLCPKCGSPRWVSVSLDGGWTRRAQCVPCGAYHRPTIGPGYKAKTFRDPEAEHPDYRSAP